MNALSSFAIPDNAWDLSAEQCPADVPVRYLAVCEGRVLRVAVDPSVHEDLPVRELALLAPPSDRREALWGMGSPHQSRHSAGAGCPAQGWCRCGRLRPSGTNRRGAPPRGERTPRNRINSDSPSQLSVGQHMDLIA